LTEMTKARCEMSMCIFNDDYAKQPGKVIPWLWQTTNLQN